MAITPRSFRLNPRLLLVASTAVFGTWGLVGFIGAGDLLAPSAERACAPTEGSQSDWMAPEWSAFVMCLVERGQGDAAYSAATLGVAHHPTNASLLNLKGFVAARNGDHATAVYDFRTGERITGSPNGVFENNIAWTTLFQVTDLSDERTERVLLQTRGLYEVSLQKGVSCERLHTALYVEYAMADLVARGGDRHDERVRDAVSRYTELYAQYAPCLTRHAASGLVVEELISAAVMDAEMGKIAGVPNPTRHTGYAVQAAERAAELGIDIDSEWCSAAVPVRAAADACANLR